MYSIFLMWCQKESILHLHSVSSDSRLCEDNNLFSPNLWYLLGMGIELYSIKNSTFSKMGQTIRLNSVLTRPCLERQASLSLSILIYDIIIIILEHFESLITQTYSIFFKDGLNQIDLLLNFNMQCILFFRSTTIC